MPLETGSRLDRTVAIKVLPAHLSNDPDGCRRFEREARTLAALSHPHVCPIFDVGRDGLSTGSGQPVDYIVMEFLDGETLARRLARVPVHPGGRTFDAGAPEPLFAARIASLERLTPVSQYAAAADGRTFVVNALSVQALSRAVTVILNWPALLRR